MNEIKNDEEGINNEIFREYFGCHNTSFLAKNLLKLNPIKNNQIVNPKAIYLINELRNIKKFRKRKFCINESILK